MSEKKETKKTYIVKHAIGVDGHQYPIGAKAQLTDEQAKAFGEDFVEPTKSAKKDKDKEDDKDSDK